MNTKHSFLNVINQNVENEIQQHAFIVFNLWGKMNFPYLLLIDLVKHILKINFNSYWEE